MIIRFYLWVRKKVVNELRIILFSHSADKATIMTLKPMLRALKRKNIPLLELTNDEKESIHKIWSPLGMKLNYDYWRVYKTLNPECFNPYYIPDDLFWGRIVRTLNPSMYYKAFKEKCLYPVLYKDLPQPRLLINSFNGNRYDANMNELSDSSCIEILNSVDMFIIKPLGDSYGGRGVRKIVTKQEKDLLSVFNDYNGNFVCQAVVEQFPKTAVFNNNSLNTFRIWTLNLNGKTSVGAIMLRHGVNGNHVDNGFMGGVGCGFSKEGIFNGNAFDHNSIKHETAPDGSRYADITIPEVTRLVDLAVNSHKKYLPLLGFAAWDLALDINGNPVFIEVNLRLPGLSLAQLTNGTSVFGDRTEEVISYVAKNFHNVPWFDSL